MKGLSVITGIIGFIGGGIAGYFFAKSKYEKKADQEIESVKSMYEKHYNTKPDTVTENKAGAPAEEANKVYRPAPEKMVVQHNVNKTPVPGKAILQDYNGPYKPSEVLMSDVPPSACDDMAPRIIDEEEFRDSPYDTRTIWRYHDDVWTDEDGNVLNFPATLLGETGYQVARTGKECTYILDERSSTVYEVLNDVRNWHDVTGYKKGANIDEDD